MPFKDETATKTAHRNVGGRPRKEDKPEQFSIRLPPKLKFGLDLLARAQHRSLSQAMEWALQIGLYNYEVSGLGAEEQTIGSIVDFAWVHKRECDRLIAVYTFAPSLLPFEQAKACEMVLKSYEYEQCDVWSDRFKGQVTADDSTNRTRRNEYTFRVQAFFDYVGKYWDALSRIAIERANAGKNMHKVTLMSELGHLPMFNKPYNPRIELFPFLRAMTDHEGDDATLSVHELVDAQHALVNLRGEQSKAKKKL